MRLEMSVKSEGSGVIRVRKQQLDQLSRTAFRSGSSLDAFVERILETYVDWDMWAAQAGFIQMHKSVLKNLFESVDESIVRMEAENLARETRTISLLITGESDAEASLRIFKKMISRSGFHPVSDKEVLMFQHNMGINCSKFYAILLERLIDYLGKRSRIEYTKNVLSARLL